MPQGKYLPEGMLINTDTNKNYISGTAGLARAAQEGAILEATAVMCDAAHNLTVDVGGIRGVIPRKEAALGIESGRVKDIAIISRVGKPVCFKVIGDRSGEYLLSRRAAQQEAHGHFMEELERGEVIKSIVTHIEPFGAFVDIGCGIVSLIGIENISVARISHPGQRFVTGRWPSSTDSRAPRIDSATKALMLRLMITATATTGDILSISELTLAMP